MYSEKNVINEEIKKNTGSEEEIYINNIQIADELGKQFFMYLIFHYLKKKKNQK
jgi:hypothetical protein